MSALLGMLPVGGAAQTLTSGTVRGVVTAADGLRLADAHVVIEDERTGIVHDLRTDASGRFAFRLLPPGEYRVFAEKLGYRPRRLDDIPLRAGRSVEVALLLDAVEPPVESVDSSDFAGAAVAYSRAGASRWFDELEVSAPRDQYTATDLAPLASMADVDLSVEGLPSHLSRLAVEGVAFQPVADQIVGVGPRSPQALAAFDNAELVTLLTDVQWDGAAGAQLLSFGRRGARTFSMRSWGSGATPDIGLGRFSDDVGGAFDLGRAGFELGGPIIRDTALFLVGAEWRSAARAIPRAFRLDDPNGALVAAAARDADGISLLGLTLPYVEQRDELAGWGRFDWRVSDGQSLSSWIDFAYAAPADEPAALRATPLSAGTGAALDAAGGVTLRSILTPRFANELRVALTRSTRDETLPGDEELRFFVSSGLSSTAVVDGSLLFGAAPIAPFTVERTAALGEQALLIGLGDHTLKLGVGVEWETRDQTFAYARAGAFTFGGAEQFESRFGAFVQSVGAVPAASWSTFEYGAFIQDSWRPASGLEVVGGLRVSDERLPGDGPQPAGLWAELTGLRNHDVESRIRQISPRLGFRWDVRDENRWLVRGGIGIYHDDVSPELITEWITHDGGVRVRRAFGELGAWPGTPDSMVAPVVGSALTLFGPEFRPPRSTRASVGFSRLGATSLHLSASYRHTDFLPARRDLNRLVNPVARDQFGRPIFGTLRQSGALVAAEPGSNRRFDAFDVVSGLEATSFSDYWDATVLLERRLGRSLRVAASYTFSRTRDDWLARNGTAPVDAIAPQLGDSASESDWSEGVSDFDAPHRASVVAELTLPLPLAPVLGVNWRMRSGVPFTPGFRAGVDVNGDYASNDPAFVDADVAGMAELLDRWDCLRDQTEDFAERNSCRGDALQFLDARIAFALTGFADARLFVDAINLLDNELAAPDAALYLIDADASLQDDGSGTVTIPLVANPDFGEPLRSRSSGRVWRIGAELAL